ncbi:hypothetical protein DIPPA_58772 [Diplonema papillatum]|nr:hypothetical protein DIPPA_58772 [Diplonema papillatum]
MLKRGEVNGLPFWSCDDKLWLFSTRVGGWMITDDAQSLMQDESSGLIASVGKHKGKMPNQVKEWQVGDGHGWHADPSIAVGTCPSVLRAGASLDGCRRSSPVRSRTAVSAVQNYGQHDGLVAQREIPRSEKGAAQVNTVKLQHEAAFLSADRDAATSVIASLHDQIMQMAVTEAALRDQLLHTGSAHASFDQQEALIHSLRQQLVHAEDTARRASGFPAPLPRDADMELVQLSQRVESLDKHNQHLVAQLDAELSHGLELSGRLSQAQHRAVAAEQTVSDMRIHLEQSGDARTLVEQAEGQRLEACRRAEIAEDHVVALQQRLNNAQTDNMQASGHVTRAVRQYQEEALEARRRAAEADKDVAVLRLRLQELEKVCIMEQGMGEEAKQDAYHARSRAAACEKEVAELRLASQSQTLNLQAAAAMVPRREYDTIKYELSAALHEVERLNTELVAHESIKQRAIRAEKEAAEARAVATLFVDREHELKTALIRLAETETHLADAKRREMTTESKLSALINILRKTNKLPRSLPASQQSYANNRTQTDVDAILASLESSISHAPAVIDSTSVARQGAYESAHGMYNTYSTAAFDEWDSIAELSVVKPKRPVPVTRCISPRRPSEEQDIPSLLPSRPMVETQQHPPGIELFPSHFQQVYPAGQHGQPDHVLPRRGVSFADGIDELAMHRVVTPTRKVPRDAAPDYARTSQPNPGMHASPARQTRHHSPSPPRERPSAVDDRSHGFVARLSFSPTRDDTLPGYDRGLETRVHSPQKPVESRHESPPVPWDERDPALDDVLPRRSSPLGGTRVSRTIAGLPNSYTRMRAAGDASQKQSLKTWVICPNLPQAEGLYVAQDTIAGESTPWLSSADKWLILTPEPDGSHRWYGTCGNGNGYSTALSGIAEGAAYLRSARVTSPATLPFSIASSSWEIRSSGRWVKDTGVRVSKTQ